MMMASRVRAKIEPVRAYGDVFAAISSYDENKAVRIWKWQVVVGVLKWECVRISRIQPRDTQKLSGQAQRSPP